MNLLSLNLAELEARMAELGQPRYRAGQLFEQLHRGVAPADMTNLPRTLRETLAGDYYLPTVARKLVSALDGTIKYLFTLADGQCVESVLMQYKHGVTICLSSQVGCRMGCAFCASTIGGKVRDLEAGELIGQILAAQTDSGLRVAGIVLMGIGEPLDNYDNVLRFLRLVGDPKGLNIGYRHISLSTCGLCDKIAQLAEENLPITLSISLHAPDDETRSALMPVNRKYNIDTLLSTCRAYWNKTGRRISFEYTLIAGQNDSTAQAEKLAERLNRGLRSRTETMPIHVNLIPVNPVRERDFSGSDAAAIKAFAAVLEKRGIRATVRRKLGGDIDASCGQLRRGEV
ncbi:MAG: 23S rRNA (adenine(2503)-C(2))-methyltransferase RlmN [Clostridia bacterium]|nr:23S rRNA (adenine(2503)-C(2))-methyltransferase RlmN [Clostridia bacterium]